MLNKEFKVEKLQVSVYHSREGLGAAAAKDACARINEAIAARGCANVIFAAAPSQNELLENMLKENVDWSKVRAFHQDEYVGISADEPAGFGNFLDRAIWNKANFMEVHYLLCDAADAEAKCEEYAKLLKQYPVGIL